MSQTHSSLAPPGPWVLPRTWADTHGPVGHDMTACLTGPCRSAPGHSQRQQAQHLWPRGAGQEHAARSREAVAQREAGADQAAVHDQVHGLWHGGADSTSQQHSARAACALGSLAWARHKYRGGGGRETDRTASPDTLWGQQVGITRMGHGLCCNVCVQAAKMRAPSARGGGGGRGMSSTGGMGGGGGMGSGGGGGMAGGRGNYSTRPRAFVCYLCGCQYGSKRWARQEARLCIPCQDSSLTQRSTAWGGACWPHAPASHGEEVDLAPTAAL